MSAEQGKTPMTPEEKEQLRQLLKSLPRDASGFSMTHIFSHFLFWLLSILLFLLTEKANFVTGIVLAYKDRDHELRR